MADTLISAGGGLSKSKLALANAALSDVLSGKTFYAGDKTLHTGTMHNNGRWPDAEKLTLEGSKIWMYQKQNGYLEGGLGVAASNLGNASPEHVLSGVSASSSNGLKFGGTMPNRGSISATLNPGNSKSYSAGYYNGGTVTCNSVESVIKHITFHATYDAKRNGDIFTYSVGNKIIGVSWIEDSTDSNNNKAIKYLTISGNTITYRVDGGGLPLRRFTVAYI